MGNRFRLFSSKLKLLYQQIKDAIPDEAVFNSIGQAIEREENSLAKKFLEERPELLLGKNESSERWHFDDVRRIELEVERFI
jgi:hypothetical protein